MITECANTFWKDLFNYSRMSEFTRIIYSYRYGSLVITAGFYLLNGSVSVVPYKLAAVISLYILARIITDLYIKCSTSTRKLRTIILLETVVITLLLIPTGGFESPFIWYALNPVLVAAWYLSTFFCWFTLFFYLLTSTLISASVFSMGTLDSIINHSYLILVFILITLLVQLLATLTKQLQIANIKQNESLEHIMSLYKVIEAFTNEDDLKTFFQTFTNYIAKITKVDIVFFWENNNDIDLGGQIFTNVSISKDLELALIMELKVRTEDVMSNINILDIEIDKHKFYSVLVKSSTKLFGVIGLQSSSIAKELFEKQLIFLSDVSSIILERFSMEESYDKLLLLEERNRIANEIHDSVSQRLFSIKFSLHTLRSKLDQLSKMELIDQLEFLSNSTNLAMRELRSSIYSLTTQKSEEKIFFSTIKLYLSDLEKLNDININVNLIGEEDIVSVNLKRSLYRVICEGTGNAVKHGKCSNIGVSLEIDPESINLVICDNGRGFVLDKVKYEASGLGLTNMSNMVNSYGGQIVIKSEINKGTTIEVVIPNRK